MKILKHGVYYKHEITIFCEECRCKYSVNSVLDTFVYEKPIKVIVGSIDCNWREKRFYYTICPECKHQNSITNREYEIVTKKIKGELK